MERFHGKPHGDRRQPGHRRTATGGSHPEFAHRSLDGALSNPIDGPRAYRVQFAAVRRQGAAEGSRDLGKGRIRRPPVVYLHGLLGQEWSGFLEGLSAGRRVYAPAHAGSDEPDELRHLNGMYDLVLYYDDLFEALGLGQVDLIGHSFGGMVAAEIAAAHPGRVRRLVLMDALGLWRDDAPVADHLLASPDKQAWLLLGDPASEAVRHRLALPEDPELKIKETLRRITSMASVTH